MKVYGLSFLIKAVENNGAWWICFLALREYKIVFPLRDHIPPFLLASIIPIAIAISPLSFNSQNRICPTPERRGKRVPKLVQFWDPFLKGFGPQKGSPNCSKIGQKSNNLGIHFWIPFCWGFGALWAPLGSLLGPLKLSWEASGPQKL